VLVPPLGPPEPAPRPDPSTALYFTRRGGCGSTTRTARTTTAAGGGTSCGWSPISSTRRTECGSSARSTTSSPTTGRSPSRGSGSSTRYPASTSRSRTPGAARPAEQLAGQHAPLPRAVGADRVPAARAPRVGRAGSDRRGPVPRRRAGPPVHGRGPRPPQAGVHDRRVPAELAGVLRPAGTGVREGRPRQRRADRLAAAAADQRLCPTASCPTGWSS